MCGVDGSLFATLHVPLTALANAKSSRESNESKAFDDEIDKDVVFPSPVTHLRTAYQATAATAEL